MVLATLALTFLRVGWGVWKTPRWKWEQRQRELERGRMFKAFMRGKGEDE